MSGKVDLKGKDILHGNQFSKEEVVAILNVASELENELKNRNSLDILKGKLLATLFFEPSTRTRLSFASGSTS